MPVGCHFQGCKALLRTGKRRYIKYHAFAFLLNNPVNRQRSRHTDTGENVTSLAELTTVTVALWITKEMSTEETAITR